MLYYPYYCVFCSVQPRVAGARTHTLALDVKRKHFGRSFARLASRPPKRSGRVRACGACARRPRGTGAMVKPLKGIVVSNKMMKSVTVMVERIYKHPRWGKYVRGRKKYMGASEAPRGIPKPLSRSKSAIERTAAGSGGFRPPPARPSSLCFASRADL